MPIYKIKRKNKQGLQGYKVRVNYTDTEGKVKQLDRIAYGEEAALALLTGGASAGISKADVERLRYETCKVCKP